MGNYMDGSFVIMNDTIISYSGQHPSLLFTRGSQDFDLCRCQDGVYASGADDIIEFYGRNTSVSNREYCRGFVYGADDHLRVGFDGEIII